MILAHSEPQTGAIQSHRRAAECCGAFRGYFRFCSRGRAIQRAVFWRVEGSLADLTQFVRSPSFHGMHIRFWGGGCAAARCFFEALLRPAMYASHRVFATRVLHALLRGVSRDRLGFAGRRILRVRPETTTEAQGRPISAGIHCQDGQVVLVSQDWIM